MSEFEESSPPGAMPQASAHQQAEGGTTSFEFAVRPYSPETDRSYCRTAWLHYQRFSPRVRGMRYAEYLAEYEPLVDRLLATRHVRVAHVAGHDDAIVGFACYEFRHCDGVPLVHYVSVKKEARKLGVARLLLADVSPERAAVYTALPTVRGRLPIPESWVYDPAELNR